MATKISQHGFVDRLGYYLRQLVNPAATSVWAGMGAVPCDDGTTFRVWAPYARSVFVAGSFNGWSPWHCPLAREEHGYWSRHIRHAHSGDEYRFVIHYGTHTFYRTDPYARRVTGPFSNGVIYEDRFDWREPAHAPAYRPPRRHELIIYELHVGTFEEKPGHPVGTFAGIVDKLPYLRNLGITALELMPISAFAGTYSWGYNPAHPFAVTDVYGGRDALKELVRAAHACGLAVIVDVVYNHFGPDDLSLWQFDGWHENGKGGIYFYNDWRSRTPWADTRPDFGRPEVRRFIRDNVLMWFEEFRVDGLRWDATSYIRNAHGHDGAPQAGIPEGWELMKNINAEMHARYPLSVLIAEDMQGNAWVTRAPLDGGAGFDAQWDARFVHPVRRALINAYDADRDLWAVRDAIAFRYNDDAFGRVIYTESHDEVANGKARVPEEIAPGAADTFFARKRAALGAVLVFTAPGIPMIFQGQEFLENGWFTDQVPLDWSKASRNAGIVALYRDLIRLRRNIARTTAGLTGQHVNVYHVDDANKVLAFHRWHDGGARDDVVVVANFAHRAHAGYTIGLPHPGIWRVRFNSDARRYDAGFSNRRCPDVVGAPIPGGRAPVDGMPCWGNVTLAPYAALILSQDENPDQYG